jgi:predicted ATP-grasp superfamily ATP-dependent carboligase
VTRPESRQAAIPRTLPAPLPERALQPCPDLLLVGNSVRYLAESGRRAGLVLAGLDAFADRDARAACARWDSCPPAAEHLADAAAALVVDLGRATPGKLCWTYGAGFEANPDGLRRLAGRYGAPLGNDAGVLALLAEPRPWFALLDSLAIRYPDTRFDAVDDATGWLLKPAAGCGGLAVRRATDDGGDAESARIHQRYLRGPLCSLTFAADGRAMMPLGFNRLHACFPAAGDFRFAGVVSGCQPGREQAAAMLEAARRLTAALGLRGINGLDFVIHDQQPWLLDLNARPPASLELYEDRFRRGGLLAHVDACSGRLPLLRPHDGARGLRILYARQRPGGLPDTWPDWLKDRPSSLAAVVPGQPLCSIHASAATPEAVEALLRERADQARALFGQATRDAA